MAEELPELKLRCKTPAVPDLVFGASGLGCLYEDVPQEQAMATMEAVLAAGLDYVDTAPWYGAGLSEERVGQAFQDSDKAAGVRLSTKCGRVVRPMAEAGDRAELHYIGHMITEAYHNNIPCADYTAEGVRESFRQSCGRLRRETLDCLRLHDAETEERWKEATEQGGVEAMLELKRAGKVGEVGLGMGSASFALRYLRHYPKGTFDSLMLAGAWNLMDQDGLEVLQECQRLEVTVVNVGIFASGVLWGTTNYKYKEAPPEVLERAERWQGLAERHELSLPCVALAFALLPEVVSRAAIGCKSPTEVEGNVALLGKAVPPALWLEAQEQGLLPGALRLPAGQ